MAKPPQSVKARRSRKPASRVSKQTTGKAASRTRRASKAKARQPLSWNGVHRYLQSWLNHAGGRFGLGIAIGLLVGVVVVVAINRFNHWVTQSPEGPMLATGELTAPSITDTSKKPSTTVTPAANPSPVTAPNATSAAKPAATGKTMEQLITDTQSEITEPETMPPSAPAVAPALPTPATTSTAIGGQNKPVAVVAAAPVTSSQRDGDQPAWLRNAVALRAPISGPMIAIVLDDVGVNKADAELAINLPAPVTLSMMTYADNVVELASRAHERGHELMLHVPMQPVNPKIDPGPNALLVGLGSDELKRRLDWGLGRFTGFIGINNHMGSRFTQDEAGMRLVMHELQSRGLLFLDSRTIANSVGERMARELGVPHVGRDVFLDDDMSAESVAHQLALTERIASKQGFVIAIGHPHPTTVAVLQKWMIEARQRGFILVPLSAVARREIGVPG